MMSLALVPMVYGESGEAAVKPLPRAPKVGAAVEFADGQIPGFGSGLAVVSPQELTGVLSAYQWFLNGVEVPSLGAKIYPHYGTFVPTRHEYVDLVAQASLSTTALAFDIGTGTGVLAAALAKRGVQRVVGTDVHQRPVDCANDNSARFCISEAAVAQLTSMFPNGRAPLIVCNPPWFPGSATITLDAADQAGLFVVDRLDTVPTHGRARDSDDLLHAARSREVTVASGGEMVLL